MKPKEFKVNAMSEFQELVDAKDFSISRAVVDSILSNLKTRKKNIHVLSVKCLEENTVFDITLERTNFSETLKENLTIRKRIEDSTGGLGALAKAASAIPGIGKYLKADEAVEEMEKLAAEIEKAGGKSTSFINRSKIAFKGLTTLAKGYKENLMSPEFLLTEILKAITFNKFKGHLEFREFTNTDAPYCEFTTPSRTYIDFDNLDRL